MKDLKERLSRIVVGYNYAGEPVTAEQLNATGAMTALLKDAIKPNLIQTLEHTGCIVHGGPIANIAHGCNSVIATRMALKIGDYAVTEAGFGADLGAEKFLDIKCRLAGLKPSAVVIVATVRALKYHGGVAKADLNNENLEALEKGLPNLLQHVSNITNVYKLPCVVAINAFPTDTAAELKLVEDKCKELGVNVALSEVWAKGGEGGAALATEVVRLVEQENNFSFVYPDEATIEEKLEAIVKRVYHGDGVVLTANAKKQAEQLQQQGATIPGRRGKDIAAFLQRTTNRLNLFAACFLAVLAAIPTLVLSGLSLQVPFAASSMLIAVSVSLESMRTIKGEMAIRGIESDKDNGFM